MKKLLVLCLLLSLAPASAALPGGTALADLILGEFDTNADAQLDAGEWQSGVGDSFDTMDANSDSSLSADEAGALHSDIASKTGDTVATLLVPLITKVLMSLDKDSDGKVSRAEYDKLSTSMFKKLDANQDGSTTATELADLPLKLL